MAFMASGDGHGYSHDADGSTPPRAREKPARRRASRRLSRLSFLFSATLIAGLGAIALLDITPGNHKTATLPQRADSTYSAPLTPAIDALGAPGQKPDLWIETAGAEPFYHVRSLELVDLPARHEVREHGRGGRLDLLSFGDVASPGLSLHLVVYRMGDEARAPSTLFVDLARRAAEMGIGVLTLGNPIAQDTKFGMAEIAGAALSVDSRERACQVFRVDAGGGDAPYQILGWTCDDEPVTAPEIACFIDHLALTDAATDPHLRAMFEAAAARQRPECGSVPLPVPPKGV